jgi:hypothetical protein
MSYSEKTKVGDRISHNKRKKALIPCIYCNGNNVVVYQTIKDTGKLSYKCYDCFKHFSDSTPIPVNKEGFKRCCKCKQIKTIDSFTIESRQKDEHARFCKECVKLDNDRTKVRIYGITVLEYQGMIALQNNKCAICGVEFNTDNSTRAHIDHCHKTGIIRGILCHACNKVLGFARDNVNILEKSIEYLKKSS